MAGQSLDSRLQRACGLMGQQVGHVLLIVHRGKSSHPCPAGLVGQSWVEGPLVLHLCSYEVAIGSVSLGTYREWMDLKAGSVSPSFSHGGGITTFYRHRWWAAYSCMRSQSARETLSSLQWFWKELSAHQLLPKDSEWLHDHVLPHYSSPSSHLQFNKRV